MRTLNNRASDLSDDLSKIYGKKFELSVFNLRTYITVLIGGIISQENKESYLFLEEVYDNKPELFEDFLSSINIKKAGESIELVEENMKKILNYDGKSIKK